MLFWGVLTRDIEKLLKLRVLHTIIFCFFLLLLLQVKTRMQGVVFEVTNRPQKPRTSRAFWLS